MPAPPKPGESKDKFISRCISYMNKNEAGKYPDPKQRAAICYSMWKNKDKKKQDAYQEFTFEVPMTVTTEVTLGAEGGIKTSKTRHATAIVGDKFYKGHFMPASELEKAYGGWEGSLHDINHQGTTDFRGFTVSSNILYFVGYNDNVKYDPETKKVSMDIHYDNNTRYGKDVEAYVNLCDKAGQIPNVSVAFNAKVGIMKASELPEGVDYKQYGLSADDSVNYLYNIQPKALSTVLQGACSSDTGCGIGLDSPNVNNDGWKEVDKARKKLIKELEEMDKKGGN